MSLSGLRTGWYLIWNRIRNSKITFGNWWKYIIDEKDLPDLEKLAIEKNKNECDDDDGEGKIVWEVVRVDNKNINDAAKSVVRAVNSFIMDHDNWHDLMEVVTPVLKEMNETDKKTFISGNLSDDILKIIGKEFIAKFIQDIEDIEDIENTDDD